MIADWCFADEMLARVDAALTEPDPREERLSTLPPPNPRQRDTFRPGARKEK